MRVVRRICHLKQLFSPSCPTNLQPTPLQPTPLQPTSLQPTPHSSAACLPPPLPPPQGYSLRVSSELGGAANSLRFLYTPVFSNFL